MADPTTRWTDNASGRFYVDENCICCAVCVDIAPDHFRESDEETHKICYTQPATDIETELCVEAAEYCPVEAIGQLDETEPSGSESARSSGR